MKKERPRQPPLGNKMRLHKYCVKRLIEYINDGRKTEKTDELTFVDERIDCVCYVFIRCFRSTSANTRFTSSMYESETHSHGEITHMNDILCM